MCKNLIILSQLLFLQRLDQEGLHLPMILVSSMKHILQHDRCLQRACIYCLFHYDRKIREGFKIWRRINQFCMILSCQLMEMHTFHAWIFIINLSFMKVQLSSLHLSNDILLVIWNDKFISLHVGSCRKFAEWISIWVIRLSLAICH